MLRELCTHDFSVSCRRSTFQFDKWGAGRKTMGEFTNSKTVDGFSVKLWRGERMALIGMDVEEPEDNLVGFSIEVQSPGSSGFVPLRNRLAFSYDKPATEAVTGYRNFDSTEAPFQKFRWIHFPYEPKGGDYTYRVTKRHMKDNGSLFAGTSITLDISLDVSVYDGFLDVGFARNYASSQAYADQFGNRADIIPPENESGLDFKKKKADDEIYRWLGFEAYDLIFGFLDDAVADNTIEIDCFAYDLNEPDIVDRLSQLGSRLRIIIDDSGTHKPQDSDESRAAAILSKSAGKKNVQRMHFSGLQHNKVLIAKRDGQAFKVLHGSTNFSFRGIYIQANNALVFRDPQIAGLFEEVFETAFTDGVKGFNKQAITQQWHMVQSASRPPVHFCFSP